MKWLRSGNPAEQANNRCRLCIFVQPETLAAEAGVSPKTSIVLWPSSPRHQSTTASRWHSQEVLSWQQKMTVTGLRDGCGQNWLCALLCAEGPESRQETGWTEQARLVRSSPADLPEADFGGRWPGRRGYRNTNPRPAVNYTVWPDAVGRRAKTRRGLPGGQSDGLFLPRLRGWWTTRRQGRSRAIRSSASPEPPVEPSSTAISSTGTEAQSGKVSTHSIAADTRSSSL